MEQRQPTLDFFVPRPPPEPRPTPRPTVQERHAPYVFIPGTPARCLVCGFLWDGHPDSIKGSTQVAPPSRGHKMQAKTWELAYVWFVLQILDVITTATALMHGADEANPLMNHGPWLVLTAKAGAGVALCATVILLPHRLQANTGIAILAGIAIAGAVVAWNTFTLFVIGGMS